MIKRIVKTIINKRRAMKRCLPIAALLSILSSGILYATFEFRSPLSVRRGMMHWPLLAPIHDAWWHDMMPGDQEESPWNIYTWSAAYYRCSDKAYFNVEKNKNTRKTTSLSTLWFGKDSFRGEEIFTGGFLGTDVADLQLLNRNNIFLSSARITPRFDYNEHGAFWGLHVDRRFGTEEKWHAGGKISVPFKVIEIEQNNTEKLEETLDDLVRFRQLNLDAGAADNSVEYAARFDFLNTLLFTTGVQIVPFVRYNATGTIDLSNVAGRLTGTSADQSNTIPAAYVRKQDNGEFPVAPFRQTPVQASSQLGVDGSGADGGTFFLNTNVPYRNNLKLDRDAQERLFVVPRATDDGTSIVANANSIGQNLQNIIANNFLISEPVSEFFRARGIGLAAHERITAIGDIETEIYCGYGHRNDWFIDGILGVRLPSGKKNKDPRKLFFQSTGHNRHFEIKLGVDGGWMPREWFAFKIDASFHHAFRRTEKRAALFRGATVRNIGPEIDTRVSWSYFIVHGDLNFFHPHNPDLGCVIGYELFAKRNDKVEFKDCEKTTDLLGRENQELDAEAFEERTNSMSHKIRGEIFHRWNFCEIFAGTSHIIAGRNVMKETEGHIGFAVYF